LYTKFRVTFFSIGTRIIPSLTDFRAAMEQVTVLAILAVDFHMFPRRFAKTETSGFSLMDAGVGFFAISSGITLGIRDTMNLSTVLHSLRTVLTTAALGAGRLIAVKLSGYPEHVGEYGVHWNFFFTLSTMTLLVTLISWPVHAVINKLPANKPAIRDSQRQMAAAVIGIGLLVLHQWLLNECGLAAWALRKTDPSSLASTTELRNILGMLPTGVQWFLDKNREGVCSILAYAGLAFLGDCFGRSFFKPLTSLSVNVSPLLRPSKILSHTLKPVTFSLACLLAVRIMRGWLVSRTLVTVPYAIFTCIVVLDSIAAINGMWWVLSLVTSDLPRSHNNCTAKVDHNEKKHVSAPPVRVLDGISSNLLITFLLANVLTGGVNFSVNSLTVDDLPAFGIVATYALILSFVTAVFSRFNIKIKL